ncbi:MAG: DUF2760 domain-containing protein [Candidatus Sumerlaeia bacterium]|nr:DUF2760 domain-containing protein [Candidatus Sumerlaeia bacterium]
MHLVQAIKAFFRVLAHGEGAAPAAVAPPPPDAFRASPEPAVQLLALLQKEGRLVDFLREDIAAYSDADIGAAVRAIHAGCRKVLDERVALEPIVAEAEGAAIAVPADFDPSAIALTGNLTTPRPHRGTVRHRGWRVTRLDLPTIPPGSDPHVAAPAVVEIG